MVLYLTIVNTILLVVILGQRGIKLSQLREIKKSMATQEERLRAILEKLPAIQAGVDRIQTELETLKANNPDIEDELAGLEAAVGAVHDDVNPPAPEPEPAPAPEGGGTV